MAFTVIRDRLKLDEEKNREKYLKKINLRFSGRFRWNIFIIFLIIGFCVMAFFIPLIGLLAVNGYFFFTGLFTQS